MKTTLLKNKQINDFTQCAEETQAEKDASRKHWADLKAINPCLKLAQAFEDADGYEDEEGTDEIFKKHTKCMQQFTKQVMEKRNPGAVIAVVDGLRPGDHWKNDLVNPPGPDGITPDRDRDEPMDARRFTLLFALPGYEERDHIRLSFETQVDLVNHWETGAEVYHETAYAPITFTVHVGGSIVARGSIESEFDFFDLYDTAPLCLKLEGPGATQELADLILKQCIDVDYADWPLGLYARFALLGRCHQCNRPLTDHVSKILQIGPTCAKKIGLEHSSALAQKVTALRAAS